MLKPAEALEALITTYKCYVTLSQEILELLVDVS
jgi:hypothetical protein